MHTFEISKKKHDILIFLDAPVYQKNSVMSKLTSEIILIC